MKKVRRAIISVTDKTGVAEFAKELSLMGIEIISTGGTEALLKKSGVDAIPISSFTGFPEMLEGRLKTLHPKIHGGILAKRNNPGHAKDAEAYGILPIDMVVVNLYAFEETVAEGRPFDAVIEAIDIGGPTMIRASAKNFRDVAVVVDPSDYNAITNELKEKKGHLTEATRFLLAKKAFKLTASYDAAISNYLSATEDIEGLSPRKKFPDTVTVQFEKVQDLRYGENPHQHAAFYRTRAGRSAGLGSAKQVHGKELSYNNILDLNSALLLAAEFSEPASVIIKHNNPCGVSASKEGLLSAYKNAYQCDRVSAFGGIVGFNRVVGKDLADELSRIFLEAIIAPGFEEDALKILSAKKNLRLLTICETGNKGAACCPTEADIKKVCGGVLLQTPDIESATGLKTVTKRGPTDEELNDLMFAWKVCKHVKSNAIILAGRQSTIGIGAGQMSRIDSTRISVMKAQDAGLAVKGAVLSSDAFFPFRDNVDLAAKHGITAIVQPGGSIKDAEVIKAADEHGIAMVFTGIRHFRH